MATARTATFSGRHWETGTLVNILQLQGFKAPHTGTTPSEALLMGISGGANMGYFTFAYPNYPAFAVLLTRNTFDPMPTLYERLAWPHEAIGTPDADKGLRNVQKALDDGYAPMVLADIFCLDHYGAGNTPSAWSPMPMVVASIEGDVAWVADRSSKAWPVALDQLAVARGKVKDLKNKVVRYEAPNWDLLPAAIEAGIRQTISLFTEDPPKGAKDRFGFLAFAMWGELLTNTRNKQSWERYFGNGYGHYLALAGSHMQPGLWQWIMTACGHDGAERGLYADFLDEASGVIGKPALREVALHFRASAEAWRKLAHTMLPDSIPSFGETRRLRTERSQIWFEQGHEAISRIRELDHALESIRTSLKAEFPLSDDEVRAQREAMADALADVAGIEREAITALIEVMK